MSNLTNSDNCSGGLYVLPVLSVIASVFACGLPVPATFCTRWSSGGEWLPHMVRKSSGRVVPDPCKQSRGCLFSSLPEVPAYRHTVLAPVPVAAP